MILTARTMLSGLPYTWRNQITDLQIANFFTHSFVSSNDVRYSLLQRFQKYRTTFRMQAHLVVAVQLEMAGFFGVLIVGKVSSFSHLLNVLAPILHHLSHHRKKCLSDANSKLFRPEKLELSALWSPKHEFSLSVSIDVLRFLSRPPISRQGKTHEEVWNSNHLNGQQQLLAKNLGALFSSFLQRFRLWLWDVELSHIIWVQFFRTASPWRESS